MNLVYVALGSNLGDRDKNIADAILLLSNEIMPIKSSEVYETEAIGMEEGHYNPFKNAVIEGFTELSPEKLLYFLLKTELKLGRVRNNEMGHYSRIIDLDLIMYNTEVLDQKDLKLPHPRLHERLFVLKPLMDLNPELEIPVINKKVKDLYAHLFHINK